MRTVRWTSFALLAFVLALFAAPSWGDHKDKLNQPSETPTEIPRIPEPNATACELPAGFTAQVVMTGLNYPTSIEFDDAGVMYIAEAGESPGDDMEPFFRAKKEALGQNGFEHVTTAGPRRPIAVRFSPDNRAMFVLDFGPIAMVPSGIGALPRSFPGTGTVWVITPTAGR